MELLPKFNIKMSEFRINEKSIKKMVESGIAGLLAFCILGFFNLDISIYIKIFISSAFSWYIAQIID